MLFEKAYTHLYLKELDIAIAALPKAFEGYKIAQLSDVHLNAQTPLHALSALVERLNALELDMIALTGDLFDAHPDRLSPQLRLLKQLRHPVYFVSGNHDLVHAKDALSKTIAYLGFVMMDNQKCLLEKSGEQIQLLGFSDAYSRYFGIRRPIKTLLKSLDTSLPTLLLAHQPKDFHFSENIPIVLQLSGHTHAGQIFPFHYVVRLFQPYLYGLHRQENRQLYVTSGYGSWGIKMRFLAPSEVAIITLKKHYM